MAASASEQNAWSQLQPQPAAEDDLQGRSDDGDHQAIGRAAARRLSKAARARHQAESGEADAGATIGIDHARDVEDRGGIQPRKVSQAEPVAGLLHVDVAARASDARRRTPRRKRFEGEHPLNTWQLVRNEHAPNIGYAPSEYRKKQWSQEAQIEGWFPQFEEEQLCFDVVGKCRTDLKLDWMMSDAAGCARLKVDVGDQDFRRSGQIYLDLPFDRSL